MKTPHKHAELIKAWADGAEIEVRSLHTDNKWVVHKNPQWLFDHEYRIKPEPKPDVVLIRRVDVQCPPSTSFSDGYLSVGVWPNPNIKLTFDGETGKLKSAEVI